MRSAAPDLLPIFRSRHQADLLARLYLHPDDEFTVTELAVRLGLSMSTVHREAERLVEAGLIHDRSIGRSRLLRAATDHRAAAPLTQLLLLTFGPLVVVEEAFAGVPEVRGLYIYGSWAARYEGQAGPPPGDVDVLVIGAPSRKELYEAADAAQERLGLKVNPTVRTVEQWTDASDALVQQIKASPVVTIFDVARSGEADDPR
jgi:DNA-binding transcriptional ArsR family regulator